MQKYLFYGNGGLYPTEVYKVVKEHEDDYDVFRLGYTYTFHSQLYHYDYFNSSENKDIIIFSYCPGWMPETLEQRFNTNSDE